MEIYEGIEIIHSSLYLKEHSTLVLSDLHIGYEGEMHKKGVLIPKTHFKKLLRMLDDIFSHLKKNKLNVSTIVLNGDVKHDFGKISEQEWREILRLIDYLQLKCKSIIVVEGNHDPVLGPIAAKRDIKLVKDHKIDDIYIIHGDEEPTQDKLDQAAVIIMGHEHPALSLQDGARVERFKCFLKGEYEGVPLICMPSSNPLTVGTDMIREPRLSPLLKGDISKFEAYIVADEVYYFGKLKDI